MAPPDPAPFRARLRAADRALLRACADRARWPRQPMPAWPAADVRLPPPPLAELACALCPPGAAADSGAAARANATLVDALAARRQLACAAADAAADGDDVRAALDAGDRDRLAALLTDLPGELERLATLPADAATEAPALAPGLAAGLWREHILPWTRACAVAHLGEP